jgi:hypothetical protein
VTVPRPPGMRAKIAEANRRRGRRARVEVAAKLALLGELTDSEAARLVGRDRATVRSIRDEFNLPGPRSRPMSERPRDELGRLLPHRPAGARRVGGERSKRPCAPPAAVPHRGADGQSRASRGRAGRGLVDAPVDCSSCGVAVRSPSKPPGWSGQTRGIRTPGWRCAARAAARPRRMADVFLDIAGRVVVAVIAGAGGPNFRAIARSVGGSRSPCRRSRGWIRPPRFRPTGPASLVLCSPGGWRWAAAALLPRRDSAARDGGLATRCRDASEAVFRRYVDAGGGIGASMHSQRCPFA